MTFLSFEIRGDFPYIVFGITLIDRDLCVVLHCLCIVMLYSCTVISWNGNRYCSWSSYIC